MIIQSAPHSRVHSTKTNSHRFWQLLDTTFCRELMWLDQFHISTVQLELFWSLWMVSKSTTKRMRFSTPQKNIDLFMGCLPSTGEFAWFRHLHLPFFSAHLGLQQFLQQIVDQLQMRPGLIGSTELGFFGDTVILYNGILTILYIYIYISHNILCITHSITILT